MFPQGASPCPDPSRSLTDFVVHGTKFALPVLVKFRASRTIWRDPVKHTGQNDSEWYRKCSEIRSGGRILNISGPTILQNNIFCL